MTWEKQSASRRRTPWDRVKDEQRTPTQEFIKTNYDDAYDTKHLSPSETNEAALVNSMVPSECPFCHSNAIIKKGKNDSGVQRYCCKDCRRRFLPTTGTIFDGHKVPVKDWIDYSLGILRYVSITADSWSNRNAFSTSRYWLHKLFLVLDGYPSTIVLGGKVWLDETFYSLRAPDVEPNPDGSKPRGLSRNKICIGVACDKQHMVCYVLGYGKPTQKAVCEAFKDHILPGATLVHDEEGAHKKLVHELCLVSEAHGSKDLKGVADKNNPLFRVNNMHARLKNFLDAHSSFLREDLQNYLNLFSLAMNPPHDKLEKVEILLNLAFQNPKLLRYREFYQAKSRDSDDC